MHFHLDLGILSLLAFIGLVFWMLDRWAAELDGNGGDQ